MPLPKPKLLAGWRRAKLIALINESYLSFRVAAPVGLWSTRLRCPQIHRLDLFVTRWPSTCDAQRNQNSEPKFRPPAVSKSLTRSRTHDRGHEAGRLGSHDPGDLPPGGQVSGEALQSLAGAADRGRGPAISAGCS